MKDLHLPIVFSGDRPGVLLASDTARITFEAPFPSPPGSTVRGKLEGVACEVQAKVRACKKIADREPAEFFIDGRLQNATRELLAVLRDEAEATPES